MTKALDTSSGRARSVRDGRPPAWRAGLLLVALAAVLAGCAGEPEPFDLPAGASRSAPGDPASGSPATTAEVDTDERVLADYEAYWADLVAAFGSADPDLPALDDHAAGTALADARRELTRIRAEGLVAQGEPRSLDPRLTLRDGPVATVVDCVDVRRWLYHEASTGRLADEPPAAPVRATVGLVREAPGWKVSTIVYSEGACGD